MKISNINLYENKSTALNFGNKNQNEPKSKLKDAALAILPAPIAAVGTDYFCKERIKKANRIIDINKMKQSLDYVHATRESIRGGFWGSPKQQYSNINCIMTKGGSKDFLHYVSEWLRLDYKLSCRKIDIRESGGLTGILHTLEKQYDKNDIKQHTLLQVDGLKRYILSSRAKGNYAEILLVKQIQEAAEKYHTTIMFSVDDSPVMNHFTERVMKKGGITYLLDGVIEEQFYVNENRDVQNYLLTEQNKKLASKKLRVIAAAVGLGIGALLVLYKNHRKKIAKKEDNKV